MNVSGDPPAGVNVNVRSKTVGWKTAVPPTTCAGAHSAFEPLSFCVPAPWPLALLTTIGTVMPLSHVAVAVKAFFEPVGSADAAAAKTRPSRHAHSTIALLRIGLPPFVLQTL